MSGNRDEALPVGRPVEFVDVQIGRRQLTNRARRQVRHGEALFVNCGSDYSCFRSHRHQRPGGTRRVFRKQECHSLAIGRPCRISQVPGQIGQFVSGSSHTAYIQLELA